MSRLCLCVLLVLLAPLCAVAWAADSSPAADALLRRVLPNHADHFVTELIPPTDGAAAPDVFELDSRGSRIVLRGTSPVSIASALNWYLKYDCHCQVSWCGSNLNLPNPLPLPA